MKRRNTLLVIGAIALMLFTMSSCKKDRVTVGCNTAAVIQYSGPEATDGCGWMVNIANTDYHVDSLPAAFQVNGMHVTIGYTVDTSRHYRCGLAAMPYPTIIISCISANQQ